MKLEDKNPLDQWLKSSFDLTNTDGMDGLWDKIDQTLDQKKKKKRAIIWFPALLIGLISAGIIGYAIYNSGIEHSATSEQFKNTVQNNGIDNNNIDDPSLANDADKATSATNNTISPAESAKDQNLKRTAKKANSLADNDAINTTNTGADQKQTDDNAQSTENKAETIAKTERNFEKKGSNPLSSNPFLEKPLKEGISKTNLANDLTFKSKNRKLNLIASSYPSLANQRPNVKIIVEPPFDPKNDDTFKFKGSWTFGVNVGFSPSKELIAVSNSGLAYVHKDYLNIRQTSEKAIVASQYEAFVRKHFGRFYTQLGFTQMTKAYSQNYNFSIFDIPITNEVGTTPDENGRYPLDDQTPYLRTNTPDIVNYSGKVTRTFTEIPLSFGFTFNAKKLLISPSFGMGLNLQNQIGGKTIDYQELTITDLNGLFKIDQRSFTMFGGLAMEYPLLKNLYLQAQPFYHRFLTNNTRIISQTPISYGINLGLNYKITRK